MFKALKGKGGIFTILLFTTNVFLTLNSNPVKGIFDQLKQEVVKALDKFPMASEAASIINNAMKARDAGNISIADLIDESIKLKQDQNLQIKMFTDSINNVIRKHQDDKEYQKIEKAIRGHFYPLDKEMGTSLNRDHSDDKKNQLELNKRNQNDQQRKLEQLNTLESPMKTLHGHQLSNNNGSPTRANNGSPNGGSLKGSTTRRTSHSGATTNNNSLTEPPTLESRETSSSSVPPPALPIATASASTQPSSGTKLVKGPLRGKIGIAIMMGLLIVIIGTILSLWWLNYFSYD